MKRAYQDCVRCVLNTNDDPYITFDDEGICNHCRKYEKIAAQYPQNKQEKTQQLRQLIQKI